MIGVRIQNELVQPFREIEIDETEFACLKAIVFFDPHAPNLKNREKVGRGRTQIQTNLEEYIQEKQYDGQGRFGELLLMIPNLNSIARSMIEQIKMANAMGVGMDALLEEMLLGRELYPLNLEKEPSSTISIPMPQFDHFNVAHPPEADF